MSKFVFDLNSVEMFRYLVVLGLATLALGAPRVLRKRFNSRIVGGDDTDITQHPHQVSLEWYGQHICGGSIVTEKFIVTAGHCTEDSTEEELTIRVGTSVAESDGLVVKVKKINQNPKYDTNTIDYDVSVLELVDALELGDSVQPIVLPEEGAQIAAGTAVNVTGWGTLSEDDWELAPQLQVVQVNIVSNAECQADYANEQITDRMLCAGVEAGGKDSCSGDSGGPLSADGVLWGTVSWGYGCAQPGYPGVYGNVAALSNYIDEVIKS